MRRIGLEGTELAKAQCDTIRLRLLKVGTHLRVSVRRIWLSFAETILTLCFQNTLSSTQKCRAGNLADKSAKFFTSVKLRLDIMI